MTTRKLKSRPKYVDPWEAALVGQFVQEGQHGRWRIKRFDISEQEYHLAMLRVMHEAGDDETRRELGLKRCIPEGTYVSLQRKATEGEYAEDTFKVEANDGYVPVMSDTPDEIEGHAHAIFHAEGRVLIHGLGLGCLVSALLAKPEVTHIDVVEIDPDVIALTGHYYTHDPRVQIHRGDCVRMDWSPELRWDYVWHDIWTHISERNLDPEEAEHGIAYSTLFDMFTGRADDQGAWAYEEAVAMRDARLASREAMREWEERFFNADEDTRVEMAFEEHVRDHIRHADGRMAYPRGTPVPANFLQFFEDNVPGLKAALRDGIQRQDFSQENFEQWREKKEPLGNPNDEIEVA